MWIITSVFHLNIDYVSVQLRQCLIMNIQPTIEATFLPLDLVVFSVSSPSGAEAYQLSCDVSETPLQTSGALLPHITVEK